MPYLWFENHIFLLAKVNSACWTIRNWTKEGSKSGKKRKNRESPIVKIKIRKMLITE